ncbi:hypothetical protein MPLSOD_140360 [Mesorhizobium sp. SOD10]|nr:hypothetical protein MPLSOD_140360 [Mesorhizobium sp. SOD10]
MILGFLPESILVPGAGEANGRTETRHVYENTLTGANGAQSRRIPLGERETVRVWYRPGAGT